jgi:hypothetical protein
MPDQFWGSIDAIPASVDSSFVFLYANATYLHDAPVFVQKALFNLL